MLAITQTSLGGPEVLVTTDLPDPIPAADEVLVRLRAAGVNPVDAKVRRGDAPLLGDPPFVLGWDLAGTVEEVGSAVTTLAVGDEVFGMPRFPEPVGAYAERAAVPAATLLVRPSAIDPIVAAALPLVGLTVWQGLVEQADLQPGQRVLVHGGGGGLGHVAIQVAKTRGAHVTTTASASKADFVRGLGADEVIDHATTDFTEVLSDLDVVFDTIGGEMAGRSLSVLRPGGAYVTSVGRGDDALARQVADAGMRLEAVGVRPEPRHLQLLLDLVLSGALRLHVDETFALADASKAHAAIEDGHTRGKLVLTV